jgi:hypothetical protein
MSYTEWKNGWISDNEYAMEFVLDDMRADVARHKLGLVEDEEEDEESEDESENE